MQTMWEALRICLPITLMTFAIFARSEMVVTPGWTQVLATILVIAGACGTAFAMFGRFVRHRLANMVLRITLAAFACIALFHPDEAIAWAGAAAVLPMTVFGVWQHKRLVSPPPALQAQPAT